MTLLLVSLDGFAGLREAIGPQLADQLLTAVGERLRVCLRGADDVVGQLADGQFGICLAGEAESAMILGNCIQRALEVPFAGHGHELLIRASLGLVAVPRAARAF